MRIRDDLRSGSRTACSCRGRSQRSWGPGFQARITCLAQDLEFAAPVKIGNTVTALVTVAEKRDDKKIITLKSTVSNQRGEVIKKVGL